ncbi:MAG TPA: hypothetical protein VK467_03335, partial [Gemmatimonadales bacterium]|nr:hypothetical protein [Gemmatimonadales bacterium]
MARRSLVVALFLAFGALDASARAQSVTVTITPPGSNTAVTGPVTVSIEWCAAGATLGDGSLRSIVFNNQDVTNNFSYSPGTPGTFCDSYATSTGTITLVGGTNHLAASISAYYEPPPPPTCPPICDQRPSRPPVDTLQLTSGFEFTAAIGPAASAPGTDWVSGNGDAWWTAYAPYYGVAVTPDGATGTSRLPDAGPFTETFKVRNTGNVATTFTFACATTAPLGATCTPSPGSVNVGPGDSTNVAASYTTGALGAGTVTLTASGSGV